MEQANSCMLCGAILKRRAKRCYSCEAAVEASPVQAVAKPMRVDAPASVASVAVPIQEDAVLSEKLRPLHIKQGIFFVLGLVCIVSALIVYLILLMRGAGGFIFFLLGGIAGGSLLGVSIQYRKAKKRIVGEHVICGLLAENFELIKYRPARTFTEEQVCVSQLRGWDRIRGSAFFQAKYRGVIFAFANVMLRQEGGRHYTTAKFLGQWMILALDKELPAPLLISEIETKGDFGRRARAQMEQEQRQVGAFTVLTESLALAEQVLTPKFTDFLLNPPSAPCHPSSHNAMHLFFMGKQAHIGLETARKLLVPCRDVRDIPALNERIQGEIDYIKKILDGFLLTNGLFAEDKTEACDREKR